jgi:acetate kinase
MKVAVLNAGSGSIKAALVEVGAAGATVRARRAAEPAPGTEPGSAFSAALDGLGIADGDVELVGHRVVHGGRRFVKPAQIDAAVEGAIDELSCLAPLHNSSVLIVVMGKVPPSFGLAGCSRLPSHWDPRARKRLANCFK